jgi:predicted TIM-barrel fold metal-dependent hydrolase
MFHLGDTYAPNGKLNLALLHIDDLAVDYPDLKFILPWN